MQHNINELIHSAFVWATHVDWSGAINNTFDWLDKAIVVIELVLVAKTHDKDTPPKDHQGSPKRRSKRNSSYRYRKGIRKR
ncbi:hypothetical protein B4V02_24020 [Paenibacillus kribbensis]|uniref:Uncharacterized protein n=1 Tax=Paenibacillus kribbensis TaxID=172713 RepID=A0A222WUU4_9BACL|nr:hypothetical protein [Paenibacillus kribbensis]ASR49533.1 hypothetical protein B4V02_24020 [Paenibacillus kribbensis]